MGCIMNLEFNPKKWWWEMILIIAIHTNNFLINFGVGSKISLLEELFQTTEDAPSALIRVQ